MPHAWSHLEVQDSSSEGPHQHAGRKSTGPPCSSGPAVTLVLLFASFFAAALARQRFFYALLLAWLEVEGVTLHFLNNVLSLYLALEATQGVLQRLALLNTYFRQRVYTPKLVLIRTSLLSQCSGRKSSGAAWFSRNFQARSARVRWRGSDHKSFKNLLLAKAGSGVVRTNWSVSGISSS